MAVLRPVLGLNSYPDPPKGLPRVDPEFWREGYDYQGRIQDFRKGGGGGGVRATVKY